MTVAGMAQADLFGGEAPGWRGALDARGNRAAITTPVAEARRAAPCSSTGATRSADQARALDEAVADGRGNAVFAVRLAGPADWAGFVRASRALLRRGVAPEQVQWRVQWPVAAAAETGTGTAAGAAAPCGPTSGAGSAALSDPAALGGEVGQSATADLFDALAEADDACVELDPASLPDGPPLGLAGDWAATARLAALHADAHRFTLIYRAAWRIHQHPALANDPLDADRRRLERMAHAVSREAHKMKAFVRFRPVQGDDGVLRHIAWFEPEHHVQERVAPFFMRRFAQMHWLILTPRIGIGWDGHRLSYGPGGRRAEAPGADAGEALWLAYYRSIFNPARVKLAMMKREMPVRFWRNMPETQQIAQMVHEAPQRTGRMLEAEAAAQRQRQRALAVDEAVARLPSRHMAAGDEPRPGDPAGALATLARRAARCQSCPLSDGATQTVFGEGPADARIMLVGEQPGDQEDLAGRPFIGPAGQLLRSALAELNVDDRRLYLTNAVKHFKHELRGRRRIHKTASQQEAAACLDWLEAEIAVVQPELIVALGATAARSLLGRPVAVSDPAGPWWTRADGRKVLVVSHPAAILRQPAERRAQAEADWRGQLSVLSQAMAALAQ